MKDTCKPIDVKPLAEGEACNVTGAVCGEGLSCVRSATDGVERCAKTSNCGTTTCDSKTAYCATAEDGGHQCVTYRNVGDPCDQRGPYCNSSTGYCKVTTGTAGTCTAFPNVGEPCGLTTGGGGTYVSCAPDMTCAITDKTKNNGICAAPALRGAACSEAQPCVRVLACRNGTCQPLDPSCPSDAGR